MKPETKQEVYNIVAAHLLSQAVKSTVDIPSLTMSRTLKTCVYKNPDGLTCSIGCLLGDSFTDDMNLEGGLYVNGRVQKILSDKGYLTDNSDLLFLTHLQWVHDMKDPGSWREALVKVAEEHGLQPIK
jgi:hypothetical protein